VRFSSSYLDGLVRPCFRCTGQIPKPGAPGILERYLNCPIYQIPRLNIVVFYDIHGPIMPQYRRAVNTFCRFFLDFFSFLSNGLPPPTTPGTKFCKKRTIPIGCYPISW